MSEYSEWMQRQPEEFQKHILSTDEYEKLKQTGEAPESFQDANYVGISLDELKELDDD